MCSYVHIINCLESVKTFKKRFMICNFTGTLEEQLAYIGIKAHEVAGKGADLKNIEDIGAVLEEKLILDNR